MWVKTLNLQCPWPQVRQLSVNDVPNAQTVTKAFCDAHDQAYGYASETDPVEIVNVRLSARAKLHTFEDKPAVDSEIDAPQCATHVWSITIPKLLLNRVFTTCGNAPGPTGHRPSGSGANGHDHTSLPW